MKRLIFALCIFSASAFSNDHSIRYDWLTLGKKSGEQLVSKNEDGSIRIEFSFNDRGRGPSILEEIKLDEHGLMVNYVATGNSYLGSQINEQFSMKEKTAQWQTDEDQGLVQLENQSAYSAANASPEALAILIRSILSQPEKSIALLPSGTASAEEIISTTVKIDEQQKTVRLIAITGMGFTPNYAWLDENDELFAVAYGWMGMTPIGWSEVLEQLQDIQNKAAEDFHQQLAARLTNTLAKTTLIDNINMLDVTKGKLDYSTALLIENGKISAIGFQAKNRKADQIIDGKGRTLMPGLWDMHTHMSLADGLLHIAAGVTSTRDLANKHDDLMKTISAFNSANAIGPRVYKAGFIDKKSEYSAPTGQIAETLEQALEYVDWYAGMNYPQIKIYSSISPQWVKPIADRVHQHGMKLSGHIPSFMSAEQAVRDGYDEIQHINMIFLNFLADENDDTRTPVRFTLVADQAGKLDLNTKKVDEFIQLLKSRNIVVDPTVTIFQSMFLNKAGMIDPSYAMVADHLPANVRRGFLSAGLEINESNEQDYRQSAKALLSMIKKLHDQGVQIVPGTDAIPGFTLHRELELYTQAGISNQDVLKIATMDSARIAGQAQTTGSIEVGKDADLILVDGNPLKDISALRKVVWSIKGQYRYDASDLYRAIGIKPFVE